MLHALRVASTVIPTSRYLIMDIYMVYLDGVLGLGVTVVVGQVEGSFQFVGCTRLQCAACKMIKYGVLTLIRRVRSMRAYLPWPNCLEQAISNPIIIAYRIDFIILKFFLTEYVLLLFDFHYCCFFGVVEWFNFWGRLTVVITIFNVMDKSFFYWSHRSDWLVFIYFIWDLGINYLMVRKNHFFQ